MEVYLQKLADMGADLVGKTGELILLEMIQEILLPLQINIGDNVGDVAGLGSDLLESYVGAKYSKYYAGRIHVYQILNPYFGCTHFQDA